MLILQNAIIFCMLPSAVLSSLKSKCLLKQNQNILLGFSGGPDSVCLLDVIVDAKMPVTIAYFDHQLRSESRDENSFASNIAKKYEIEYFYGSEDIRKIAAREKIGIEACARKYRYQFLAEKARQVGAEVLMVAHHADDQVETILMNIIRGSGLNGLVGMPYRAPHEFTAGLPVVRPMLSIWKREILDYCESNGLKYLTDHTNLEAKYTRNKLRNEIIPELIQINPNVKENILRLQSILIDENAYLSKITEKSFTETVERIEKSFLAVNITRFRNLSNNLQRRVIMKALQNAFSMEKDLHFQMIEDIRMLFNNDRGTSEIAVTDQILGLIEGDSGFVCHDISQLSQKTEFGLGKTFTDITLDRIDRKPLNKEWVIQTELLQDTDRISMLNNQSFLTAFLDAEKIVGNLKVRRKQMGDRYAPLGMQNHSMKVSDFWINKKIPRRLRKNWPLICDAARILWIPGFQPAHAVRITESTRSILKLSLYRVTKPSTSG